MNRFADISTEELKKKVEERQAQIKKIVNFVEAITLKKGKVIKWDQGSSHTNVVRQLDGFGHFSFRSDTGHCIFGGNSFYVWYHPTEERIDTEKINPVLSVYYQNSLDECKVRVFEDGDWQAVLEHVIEHKDEIIAQIEKKEEDRQEQSRLQANESHERDQLLADAERLKL